MTAPAPMTTTVRARCCICPASCATWTPTDAEPDPPCADASCGWCLHGCPAPDGAACCLDLTGSPGLAADIAVGVAWLTTGRQPDDALLQHHGVAGPARGRLRVGLIPDGPGRPVVAVYVVHPTWDPATDRYLDPLTAEEVAAVDLAIGCAGVNVHARWNGAGQATGSWAIDAPASPSLLAAVTRYRAGCPEHEGSVFCGWGGCTWYAAGYAQLVQPGWL